MKLTARKIVELALIECGAISPNEDVDYSEVDQGLTRLNMIIGRYNADNLFAYTKYRETVSVTAGKAEYTIGLGDGLKIRSIERLDASNVKVTFNKPHGLNTTDTVNIYDTANYDGTVISINAVTERTITLDLAIATTATEYTGVVYDSGAEIPDIRKPRPNDLESLKLIESGTKYLLEKIWQNTWDQNLFNVEITETYMPHYFTYFTDYPFGKIRFEARLDRDYDLELVWPYKMDELVLDAEVDMPPGYLDALVMILADALCGSYGIDNQRVKIEAMNAVNAIRTANIEPSTVKRGRRSFNLYSGRYE